MYNLGSVVGRTVALAVFPANVRGHVILPNDLVAHDTVVLVVLVAADVTPRLVEVYVDDTAHIARVEGAS